MNELYSFLGIIIPFLGTSLGSAFVFLLKENINYKIEKLLIGFAIGVMIASSIWSLIIPAIEMSKNIIPVCLGLIFGFVFLILITKITDKINNKLMFSVTLHNIPEGMAVGVCFAGFLVGSISLVSAFLLSIGIALQNIPEGAIISLPAKIEGNKKGYAFSLGVLSGVVEPISAFVTIILLNIVVPLLPFLLSFAAGCMLHVVIEELVPRMHENNNSSFGIIGVLIGFLLMMVLDVIL